MYVQPKSGMHIAHKSLSKDGWEVGVVKRQERGSGFWLLKYPTDPNLYKHALEEKDQGTGGCWVRVAAASG